MVLDSDFWVGEGSKVHKPWNFHKGWIKNEMKMKSSVLQI